MQCNARRAFAFTTQIRDNPPRCLAPLSCAILDCTNRQMLVQSYHLNATNTPKYAIHCRCRRTRFPNLLHLQNLQNTPLRIWRAMVSWCCNGWWIALLSTVLIQANAATRLLSNQVAPHLCLLEDRCMGFIRDFTFGCDLLTMTLFQMVKGTCFRMFQGVGLSPKTFARIFCLTSSLPLLAVLSCNLFPINMDTHSCSLRTSSWKFSGKPLFPPLHRHCDQPLIDNLQEGQRCDRHSLC